MNARHFVILGPLCHVILGPLCFVILGPLCFVILGLVPRTQPSLRSASKPHNFFALCECQVWVLGTSPRMTKLRDPRMTKLGACKHPRVMSEGIAAR